MSETGALGAGTSNPELRGDKPPVVKIDGAKTRTAKVGEPLTLVGRRDRRRHPKVRAQTQPPLRQTRPRRTLRQLSMTPPYRPTVNKSARPAPGVVRLSRRRAKSTFDPPQIKTWEDTRSGRELAVGADLDGAAADPTDGKYTTKVTFETPGTYVLRARGRRRRAHRRR